MNERLIDMDSNASQQNVLVIRDIGLRFEQIYSMEFVKYLEFNGTKCTMTLGDSLVLLNEK